MLEDVNSMLEDVNSMLEDVNSIQEDVKILIGNIKNLIPKKYSQNIENLYQDFNRKYSISKQTMEQKSKS